MEQNMVDWMSTHPYYLSTIWRRIHCDLVWLFDSLSGPAPVHHTLLRRRSHTGITLQTLHPTRFDQGARLLQTPPPGIPIPDPNRIKPEELIPTLANLGAKMLIEGIRSKVFVPPLEDSGWYSGIVDHAPKITKEDRHVDWQGWMADEILLRLRVLGDLWDNVLLSNGKRLVLHDLEIVSSPELAQSDQTLRPGSLVKSFDATSPEPVVLIVTCDEPRKFLKIKTCTIEGQTRGDGARLAKLTSS